LDKKEEKAWRKKCGTAKRGYTGEENLLSKRSTRWEDPRRESLKKGARRESKRNCGEGKRPQLLRQSEESAAGGTRNRVRRGEGVLTKG